jgi:hypothetical protein
MTLQEVEAILGKSPGKPAPFRGRYVQHWGVGDVIEDRSIEVTFEGDPLMVVGKTHREESCSFKQSVWRGLRRVIPW